MEREREIEIINIPPMISQNVVGFAVETRQIQPRAGVQYAEDTGTSEGRNITGDTAAALGRRQLVAGRVLGVIHVEIQRLEVRVRRQLVGPTRHRAK